MRPLFLGCLIYFTEFVKSSAPLFTRDQLHKFFNVSDGVSHQFGVKNKFRPAVVKWDWDATIEGYRIPYQINASFPVTFLGYMGLDAKAELTKNLDKAKFMFAENTSIYLMPKRDTDTDYVEIMYNEFPGIWYNDLKRPGECLSSIGKQGGRQLIALGSCFNSVGSILHEFMHALGFIHEHQRHDRDDYVKVGVGPVADCARTIPHPDLLIKATAGTVYDYDSVMHYPVQHVCDIEVINKTISTIRFESLLIVTII